MNKKDFIKFVKNHLKEYDIKLVITKGYNIYDGGNACGGYFNESDKILKVSGKAYRWFEILCHEYCHFLQFVEDSQFNVNFNEKTDNWDEWLAGEVELPQRHIHNKYMAMRNIEIDCEKRTVELIKKYGLPINIKRYIQRANAYLFFLAYVKKHRKWVNKVETGDKRFVKLVPKRFMNNFNDYNRMPKGFEELINKIDKE